MPSIISYNKETILIDFIKTAAVITVKNIKRMMFLIESLMVLSPFLFLDCKNYANSIDCDGIQFKL